MGAPDTTLSATPLRELIDLDGRVAIVTGGAMGIGLGIARRLHEAGASVVLADLDAAAGVEAAGQLDGGRPKSAIAVECDVSDPESVQHTVDAAVEAFGGIEILVNNAGIFPPMTLSDFDLATLRRVIDVNLIGLVLCTKAASAG